MARYDYFCTECNEEFEVEQKITDEPLNECPKCKENNKPPTPPKRLISRSNFILTGGGWAADKYSK
jgi:putative FmdB family regulatory protein